MRILLGLVLALGAGPAIAQQATPALPGATKPKLPEGPGPVSRNAPINGVLTLFGNERCPTDTDGNEIVICVRRSAQEQYRVPKELREFQITPQNESWAAKAQATTDTGVGVNSMGSCSAVGAAGTTGCFQQRVREARRENAQRNSAKSLEPQ
jgi:hypothetical protein